jgi:hypothetical protein
MGLTDLAIRRAKPRERAFKVYDEKGLYLLVSPTGAKLWRLKSSANSHMWRKLRYAPPITELNTWLDAGR